MSAGLGSRGPRGLVLVGSRGSGKTTVGLILSKRLELPFWDVDREIQTRSGLTIADIFAHSGEECFRDWEERVLRELCAHFPISIVAPGGGAVLRPSNRERIRKHGHVVWLQARPDVLARRIAADGATASSRPALTSAGVLEEIESVLAEREALYAEVADFAVESTATTPAEVASAILERWTP